MQMSPQEREALHQSLREGLAKGRSINATIHLVLTERVWEERVDERGRIWKFDSFLDYLRANPPGGLYHDPDEIRRLLDPKTLDLFDREVKRPDGGNNNPDGRNQHQEVTVDNVHGDLPDDVETPGRPHGNSKQAALRRLRDQRPDLHAEVLAGEMSPHRAMREAGFRPPTMTLRLDDAERAAAALLRHCTADYARELGALLMDATEEGNQ
jgi:hypothetical protein